MGSPLVFQVCNKFCEKSFIWKKKYKHYNNLIFDAYLWVLGTEEIEYELQIARMNFLLSLFCVTKRSHQRKNVSQKKFKISKRLKTEVISLELLGAENNWRKDFRL